MRVPEIRVPSCPYGRGVAPRVRRIAGWGSGICGVVAVLLLGVASRAGAATGCPGDCDGSGTVTVAELIRAVEIGLGTLSGAACRPADRDGDGRVGIDDVVAAVRAAQDGCSPPPSATPTATAIFTATATASASARPSNSATASPSRTPTVTATMTGTETATATRTRPPSGTPTGTLTVTPTPRATHTATVTPSATPTATPTGTSTPQATHSRTRTPSETSTATATPTGTATATPTGTPTVTRTATLGVLGTRHFTLNAQSSSFTFVTQSGTLPLAGFTGTLDLSAGQPDSLTGQAVIDVIGTGDTPYLVLDMTTQPTPVPFTICVWPQVPAAGAGVVACRGGTGLDVRATQDHRLGEVDLNGFTAGDCAAAGGTVESAGQPHPGVCNGPLQVDLAGGADAGAGAVRLHVPVKMTVQAAPPCDATGAVDTILHLTTAAAHGEIQNADNVPGSVLGVDERGENFSCPNWTQADGSGRFVFTLPALHGFFDPQKGIVDAISVFVFRD